MWRDNHVWLHYVKNIIAADLRSAVFLASYIRNSSLTRNHARHLEVIDLQKYRVIKDETRIKAVLNARNEMPFIFVVGKN